MRSSEVCYLIICQIKAKSLTPFLAAPLGENCKVIQTACCVLYHIAFASTAFLFFLRVRAFYNRNKYVVAFFFISWLVVLGGALSVTAASAGSGHPLGPTPYCYSTPAKSYISASPITLAINDTFVFLAISWRLLGNSQFTLRKKPSFKAVILGQSLPAFSRALLQDGQIYYL